jgi:hypothetical protein
MILLDMGRKSWWLVADGLPLIEWIPSGNLTVCYGCYGMDGPFSSMIYSPVILALMFHSHL